MDEGRRKVIDQDIAVCRNDWGVGGRGAIVVRLTTLGHTQDSSYFIWDGGLSPDSITYLRALLAG